jgi:hypothetical protein
MKFLNKKDSHQYSSNQPNQECKTWEKDQEQIELAKPQGEKSQNYLLKALYILVKTSKK